MCYEFANRGFCGRRNCKFPHDITVQKVDKPKPEVTSTERDFRAWRSDIPLKIEQSRPLGFRLGPFFKGARRLIDESDGVLQDVVRCLSQEGGLKRIQELVECEFDRMSTSTKSVVLTKMLPFLEIITNHTVLASLVLEKVVGTIYNFLFGASGRRGAGLLAFLVSVLESNAERTTSATTMNQLELFLVVFWQIIELNSGAFVHEPLKPVAVKFQQIFEQLHSPATANSLQYARTHLDRILRRLDIGSSLPAVEVEHTAFKEKHAPPVPFVVKREPPGGRHNNYSKDICAIQIMPTFEEIRSSRTEYLPVKDRREWHIGGITGLLDRNFRLLREDTIGQLRDTIHAMLKPSKMKRMQQGNQLRTHAHRNARVIDLHFDRLAGLQFVVQFPQPADVKKANTKKREEWWERSKRLQPGALVCLAYPGQDVVFCTIAGSPRPRRNKVGEPLHAKVLSSLWQKEDVATVTLEMAQFMDSNVQCILNRYTPKGPAIFGLLVEFPGILLASFEPTLRALQQMKKSGDLPFSELLAPDPDSNNGTTIPSPPTYAVRPGFSFDLDCLLNDSSVRLAIRPGQPFDARKLQEHSTLDNAQAVALVNSLQRSVGLIQGPPGTGKSFTGVSLLKVLLANREKARGGMGPIICVCYTNHALDQLLEDLVEKKITGQIVRIGSRSKSEILQEFNLKEISGKTGKTKAEKADQWELHRELDKNKEDLDHLRLGSVNSDSNLKAFLQHHYPKHFSQLFDKDAQHYKRQRSKKGDIVKQWLKHAGIEGGNKQRSVEELQQVHVDSMTRQEMTMLHQHWMTENRRNLQEKASDILERQRWTKIQFDNVCDEINLRCLRHAHVIGVTTSGLARNLNMLRRLRSKVVLCEEAGEVQEAHLLTALLPSVEHAVLIGDHMQLRPQAQNYELSRENHNGGEQYSLDTSLFERLVNPDEGTGFRLPFSTLDTQRRMHPSIGQLVRETLYPRLEDDSSVVDYPEVCGMRKRLFWLDHRHPEANTSPNDALGTSHWNNFEVDMTVALVNHLIRQGTYKSGEIAVLTPYLGQLQRLRSRLAKAFAIVLGERDEEDLDKAGLNEDFTETDKPTFKTSLLNTLRVATIDNFQGEEAKVVVISLVRSNDKSRCGFLRTSNRINVLLSRARHGMYIIGNSATSSHVTMWAQVIDILQRDGNFGTSLELQCPRHPDNPIAVSEADHFVQYSPEGGCDQRCVNRLKCGHACRQKCHSAILHDAVYCQEPCPKAMKGCDHSCPKLCGDTCPTKCTVNVYQADRRLSCGHLAVNLPCRKAQDLSLVTCLQPVEKEVPGCKHKVTVQCNIDVTKTAYKCQAPCQTNLSCGHTCKRPCWNCTLRTEEGIQVDHGKCIQICGRNQSTCSHACNQTCHGTEACPPCSMPCDVQCAHSKCPRMCRDPCTPCAVSTCLSSCPHSQCSMPCAAPCDHIPCSRRCDERLSCGHQCPSVCGEVCPPQEYCQQCASLEVKERVVDFILAETYGEINLDENPCIFPRCGHFLTLESMDGQMDMKKYYVMEGDKPVAIRSSSEPFSVDDIKKCATCRGSLRDLSRYGRLIRRAILDESTKRFLLYLSRAYVPLAQQLPQRLAALREDEGGFSSALSHDWNEIKVEGSRFQQFNMMNGIMETYGKNRWKQVTELRKRIVKYYCTVEFEEQPFSRVRNLVEHVRKLKHAIGSFDFDESVVQTKGFFLAAALLIRLDIGLLGDFLSRYERSKTQDGMTKCTLQVDLKQIREECKALIDHAARVKRVAHEVEGHIFLAQLYGLERSYISEPAQTEKFAERGGKAITAARDLCRLYPGQTNGLRDEIDGAEHMLNGATFYSAVSSEERMAVISAMAREFRGTGHWYYCENGHPFTIGECGGAVQMSRCPECGAAVGGQGHQTADGVTRANDLERQLGQLHV